MESVQNGKYDQVVLLKIRSKEIIVDAKNGVVFSGKKDAIGNHIARGWELNGNLLFGIKIGDKAQRHFYVCRAIWLSQYGFVNTGKEVSHKDGDKKNNRIENLELSDPKRKFNPKSWTVDEIKWLEDNRDMSLTKLADNLGRSLKSVRHRIKQIGLPSKRKTQHFWKEEDDNELRLLYAEALSVEDIAKKMNRSANAIRLRANKFRMFRNDCLLFSDFRNSNNFYLSLKRAIACGSAKGRCCLCNYDRYIELHHICADRTLNRVQDIASLCPTHHVEVTYGEHKDRKLHCIWWRVYSDGSTSDVFTNL